MDDVGFDEGAVDIIESGRLRLRDGRLVTGHSILHFTRHTLADIIHEAFELAWFRRESNLIGGAYLLVKLAFRLTRQSDFKLACYSLQAHVTGRDTPGGGATHLGTLIV